MKNFPALFKFIRGFIVIIGLSLLLSWVSRSVFTRSALSIKKSFSYGADILSVDNFFDEELETFSNDTRSVTTFSYDLLSYTENTAKIVNVFDVRTVEGDKIINVKAEYDIDPNTWAHQDIKSPSGDPVYLFAPSHLEKGDSFWYIHINYGIPVEMKFQKEEIIEGLVTYKYTSSFEVDQTDKLTHLEKVPEERGVNLDVDLSLWIEPHSGWLIKYEDSALAYYYDQNTKVRLFPWNRFSNAFIKRSVHRQVEEARAGLSLLFFLEYFIPVSLAVLITMIFFRPCKKCLYLGPIVISLLLLIGYFWSVYANAFFLKQDSKKVVAIVPWVNTENNDYLENIESFKKGLERSGYREGEDVEYRYYYASTDSDKQRENIREMNVDNVNLIYSLTTPGTSILQESVSNIPIVFSVVTYPVESGIVKSLAHSGNNLVGTRNWVPVEDQLSVFLNVVPHTKKIAFLHRQGELNSTIQFEKFKAQAALRDVEVLEISVESVTELLTELHQNINSFDALFSACDTLIQGESEKSIIEFTQKHSIPSFSCNKSGVEKGDLIGLVTDYGVIGLLSGEKAALIFEGATPASLKTEAAPEPHLYINMKTASALGITVPQSVLTKAYKIITE